VGNALIARCALGMAANKLFDNPFMDITNEATDFNLNPKRIGYLLLGQYLYAVADWLRELVKENGIKTVHFTSRDGFVLKQVFDLLTANETDLPATDYIYDSRKSLCAADMISEQDWLSVIGKFNLNTLSPKKFFSTLPMLFDIQTEDDIERIKKACSAAKFVWNRPLADSAKAAEFIRFARENFYNQEAHKTYNDMVSDYFTKRIGENDLIFDIGYSGRGEAAIAKRIGFPVHSAYIFSNGDNTDIRSSLTGNILDTFTGKLKCGAPILEHLFSEYAASCIGYKRDENGEVIPEFEDFTADYQTQFIIEMIQSSAVQFTKDFISTFGDIFTLSGYAVPREALCKPLEYFLHCPADADAYIFSAASFEDEVWGQTGKRFVLKDIWLETIDKAKLRENITINYTSERVVEKTVIAADETKIAELRQAIADRDERIRVLLHSWTWRIGRLFVALPGWVKRKVLRRK
jgi:hypothetical protein